MEDRRSGGGGDGVKQGVTIPCGVGRGEGVGIEGERISLSSFTYLSFILIFIFFIFSFNERREWWWLNPPLTEYIPPSCVTRPGGGASQIFLSNRPIPKFPRFLPIFSYSPQLSSRF